MDTSNPIRPAAFYILVALVDGPSHGYALMQAAREHVRGAVRLGTGSFYRHLAALIDDGFVAETAAPRDDDPRRGAYYKLTPRGRQVLAAERERLTDLVAALDVLGPASGRGRA